MTRLRNLKERIAAQAHRPEWQPGEFGIVVDSREQKPFSIATSVPVQVRALSAGDYSVIGLEQQCAVERKSLADFIGSTTWEHDRFRAELVKLREYDFAAVVVESSMDAVRRQRYRAKVLPEFILSMAATISVRYVPVFFAGDAFHAGDLTLRLLRRFWADHVKEAAA